MTFPLDRIILGPRHYGTRPSTVGFILHTTEYPDSTRRSTDACIRAQSIGGSLYAGGGSYHWLIDEEGVTLSVGYRDIAGGLTSRRTNPPWAPEDWLKRAFNPDALWDPNRFMLQAAVSGRTNQIMSHPKIGEMALSAARLILWAEQQPWAADNLVVSGHEDWQSNKSDPGAAFIELVMDKYHSLVTVPPPVPVRSMDWAGKESAFGTLYPNYVHTDGEALAWVNRNIIRLREAGKL